MRILRSLLSSALLTAGAGCLLPHTPSPIYTYFLYTLMLYMVYQTVFLCEFFFLLLPCCGNFFSCARLEGEMANKKCAHFTCSSPIRCSVTLVGWLVRTIRSYTRKFYVFTSHSGNGVYIKNKKNGTHSSLSCARVRRFFCFFSDPPPRIRRLDCR